jgi:hypothetical protein
MPGKKKPIAPAVLLKTALLRQRYTEYLAKWREDSTPGNAYLFAEKISADRRPEAHGLTVRQIIIAVGQIAPIGFDG